MKALLLKENICRAPGSFGLLNRLSIKIDWAFLEPFEGGRVGSKGRFGPDGFEEGG